MGMYRGLLPRLCANLTTSVTYQAVGHVSHVLKLFSYEHLLHLCQILKQQMRLKTLSKISSILGIVPKP